MDPRAIAMLKTAEEQAKEETEFRFPVRATKMQLEAVERLAELESEVTALKREFIDSQDEDSANLLLGVQCAVAAVRLEIECWLSVKQDRPDQAWDKLVGAQYATRGAGLAHPRTLDMGPYLERLANIEGVVFPHMIFVSSAFSYSGSECSICHREYEGCEHIQGEPYMGEFCSRIISHVTQVKEVSFVDEPADRRTRVCEISDDDGVRRHILSWLPVEETSDEHPCP